LKIVFFGTPDFAVPTLSRLLEDDRFEVVGVVTQPDTRRGRGNALIPSPIKVLALDHHLPVWQPERLKKDEAVLRELAETEADFFVVVAYGQILSRSILEMPRRACVNVHGSLLPKYRGAAPIQWAIVNGETTTGITTMLMDTGIDTGAMLLTAETAIDPHENAATLGNRLASMGAELLVQTLLDFDQICPQAQDDRLSSYAPLIKKEDCRLDLNQSAQALHDRIRGFYPDCWLSFRNERIKILETEVVPSAGELGTIAAIVKNQGFVLQTADQGLLIKKLQPPAKKVQTGWDFLNGARLKVGASIR
jgi:methionyl-tRNA formyltransferase